MRLPNFTRMRETLNNIVVSTSQGSRLRSVRGQRAFREAWVLNNGRYCYNLEIL